MDKIKRVFGLFGFLFFSAMTAFAGEADLAIPDLHKGAPYTKLGGITPWDLLFYGACIIEIGRAHV